MKKIVTTVLIAFSMLALSPPVMAQGGTDFYKGKQIRFVVGTASGQEYDLWARLIGRHLTRHLAGNPTLIVENMPGAGHIIATNYLFNVAPRDGTVIGMVSRNMTDAAVMSLPNVRYEPAKFNWLGSPELSHRVMFVGPASGIEKVPDLFERELIVGAPGGVQGVTAAPILLKNLLGMKLKIVQGYRSPNDVVLAVARGEVGGFVNTVGGPEGARQQWLASRAAPRAIQHGARNGGLARRADRFRLCQERRTAAGADLLCGQHAIRPAGDGAAGCARRACRPAAPCL